jgi:1-acyl-sn-glycerol-3-phosphate acyltransferase
MMIKGKPLPPFFLGIAKKVVSFYLHRRFNKLVIHSVDLRPHHSYILMCNHFSFLDGVLAYYLCTHFFWGKDKMKYLHIMSLKQQLIKNKWLRYFGSFSIQPGKRSITQSFEHAAHLLSKPGNLLLFYPQGNLESMHVRKIEFQQGLSEIVQRIQGPCQLIWCSNVLEFFESTKPSLSFNLLDCGTADHFDFDKTVSQVNQFHQKSIQSKFRFTEE